MSQARYLSLFASSNKDNSEHYDCQDQIWKIGNHIVFEAEDILNLYKYVEQQMKLTELPNVTMGILRMLIMFGAPQCSYVGLLLFNAFITDTDFCLLFLLRNENFHLDRTS